MTTGTLAAGQQLQNRYTVQQQLGSGGMSVVYLALDTRLGNSRVALKELSMDAVPLAERVEALQAFEREAQLLAQLDHPGLTKVSDFFSEGGRWYLIMEYVDGETLAALAQRQGGKISETEAKSWTLQLCDVLEYLHSRQPPVIFRDLKPDNIMRTGDGRIKLIDFGIARFFKAGQTRDTRHMGTPGFASPEQYGKGQTDARSDIYSLGATLHHLLTGYDPAQSPFTLPTVQALNPAVSASFAQVIQQAIQLLPDQRHRSVAALRTALAGAGVGPSPTRTISQVSAPTQVHFSRQQDQATISWATPPNPSGAPITAYRVEANPGGKFITVQAHTTSTTLRGLDAQKTYTFSVAAISPVGVGAPVYATPASPLGPTPIAPVAEPAQHRTGVQRAGPWATVATLTILSAGLIVLPAQLTPLLIANLPRQWTVALAANTYRLETMPMLLAGFSLLGLALAYYLTHRPGLALLTAISVTLFNSGWGPLLLGAAGTLEVGLGLSAWRTRNSLTVGAAGILGALLAGYFLQLPVATSMALGIGGAGGVLLAAIIGAIYRPLTGIGRATTTLDTTTNAGTPIKRAGVVKYLLVVVLCGLACLFLPWWGKQFVEAPLQQALQSWQMPERWRLAVWSMLLTCLTVWPLLLAYFATQRPGAALLATLLGSIPVLLLLRTLGLDLTQLLFVVTFFGSRDLQVLLICGLSIEFVFMWRQWRTRHIASALLAGLAATAGALWWLQTTLNSTPGWEQIAPLVVGAGLAGLLALVTGDLFNWFWPQ